MSLDYPFYEELRRLKHRGARWWLIGDRLYYLGLLPAMLALPSAAICLLAVAMELEWGWPCFWLSLGAFPVGVVVWFIGASLKGHAYRLAERDGISAADVYNRGKAGDGPGPTP
jgi:hypothetical protein